MSPFEIALPGRVLFGRGKIHEAGPLLRGFGARALVVTGRSVSRAAVLREQLNSAGVETEWCPVTGEPTTTAVEAGVRRVKEWAADMVIGFGGGSAIDAAKAMAVLATNPGSLFDYLEVIGSGKPILGQSLPFIAIPTTAGTGAEVTRNAVLSSPEHAVKVSLRSPAMMAKVAIVDPELTYGLSPGITAATGMDALTQLIEAFVSCRANAFTDALCRDGISLVASTLSVAFEHASLPDRAPARNDLRFGAAREAMALASLWSGIALANSGLGAVHGFAGPLGGMFGAPHGEICAVLLPEVMRFNLDALRQRAPDSTALGRYAEIGRLLTQRPDATSEDAVRWVRGACADFKLPALGQHGVGPEHFPKLVAGASRASSMKGNPIQLTEAELTKILQQALGGLERSIPHWERAD